MTILRQIADFLAFRARAAALAARIEDGVLSRDEREAAVAALLLAPARTGATARPAPRRATKTAAA